MRRYVILFCLFIATLAPAAPALALASPPITAANDKATLAFPDQVTFSVDLLSATTVTTVTLEYGVDQLTCGTVIAKGFPKFTPARGLTASWTWEMKQSGSLPPGAQIHWQWRVADADGHQLLTDRQTVTWLDSQYNWRTLSSPQISLHYYNGSQAFAQRLDDAALRALVTISKTIGLQPSGLIALYIYANSDDMQNVVFYEPGWAGGQAYAENNIAILGIDPSQETWGKRAMTHEIAHILAGRYGFGCLQTRPTWLTEGLAVYAEGDALPERKTALDSAVRQDKLISVESLSSQFAEDPATANLSYAESGSLVGFLITEYKQEKILQLLRTLRDGTAFEAALKTVYGFDQHGLEEAWRVKIGAKPGPAKAAAPVKATPTIVPTYRPVAGLRIDPTATPLPPTSTPVPPTNTPTRTVAPTLTAPPPTARPPEPTAVVDAAPPPPNLAMIGGGIGIVVILLAAVSFIILRARRHS